MSNYIELMYDALNAELGIVIQTNDPERLRQKLYAIRKERDEFHCLSFWISPVQPRTDLWIGKKEIK